MSEVLETLKRLHTAILNTMVDLPLSSPSRKQLGIIAQEIYDISVYLAEQRASTIIIKPSLWNRIFELLKLLIPFLQ